MMKFPLCTLFAMSALVLGAETFTLATSDLENRTFEGTVEYGRTLSISFEAEGRLIYVVPPGSYVRSEVLNSKGERVDEGDLLARQDTELAESNLKIQENLLQRATETLKQQEHKYLRNKRLFNESAASEKDYQESQTAYNIALLDRQKAELDLIRARHVLDARSIRAPFNGVVEELYASRGASMDVGDPVLKVSMVDPVKIVVRFSPDEKIPYTRITRALIYPAGSETPVPGWFAGSSPVAGFIECFAENPVLEDVPRTPSGLPLPVIDHPNETHTFADRLHLAPLWINENAIRKDNDGAHYVWRLKDANLKVNPMTPGAAIMEKIPVELLDIQFHYGSELLRGIKEGSKLIDSDVLAGEVPPGLKDGELAVYRRKQHLFRVGEKVRVRFTVGDGHHIFRVPQRALFKNSDNEGFSIKRIENGQERPLPVSVLNRTEGMARIYSAELQQGNQLKLGENAPGDAVKLVQ